MHAVSRTSARLLRKLSSPQQSNGIYGASSCPDPIGILGRPTPLSRSLITNSSNIKVNPTAKFSSAAEPDICASTHHEVERRMYLTNRPLSPFLSQKRPERSSTISIGERMSLIVIGLVLIPVPETAKMSLFLY